MIQLLRRFLQDTSGAVTVDWVVLTAIIVSLGIVAAANVSSGITSMSTNTKTHLETGSPFNQNE